VSTIDDLIAGCRPIFQKYDIRFPKGLSDLRPGRYYFQKDAEFAIRIAESIITRIRTTVAAAR
jgi:predicted DNA binding CopG/RHH family protein